jgi:TetR/AcrR family transcriptional repressor of mexJK operon
MSGSRPPVLRTGEQPAPPQQARSLEKRKRLLRAGRLLFTEKGYEAASIQQIAARGGAATGAFYTYFHSKRQLLVVLMNELLDRLASLNLHPTAGGDVRSGLQNFLGSVFRAEREYYGVVRAWQEVVLSDRELGAMQRTIEEWTQSRVLGVFQLLQRQPGARRDCDLPAFARMMDRHFWALLARGSRMRRQDFEHEVELAADVIYHYVFYDGGVRLARGSRGD